MRVLSGDAGVLCALRRRGYRGRVHSVFEHALNIEDVRGELLAIATRDADDAPRTLVVDVQRFAADSMAVGDAATAGADAPAFCVGPYKLRLDGARAWSATLPHYPANDLALRANLARVRARIAEAFDSSFAASGAQPSALARATVTQFDRCAATLGVGLRRRDAAAAVAAGRAMLGLGPGLTPSGDDFLVGMFAVLNMPASPSGDAGRVCRLIIADVDRHTNAISAAALKAAAHGHVRGSIVALLGALTDTQGERLADSLSRVLAIGSTSGAAIVRGVVAGFDATLRSGADTTGASTCTTLSNCLGG